VSMKILNRLILTFAIFLIGFSGCKEINTSTRVGPNGHLTRIISVKGDSAGIGESGYPIPNDSTWTIEKELVPDDSTKMVWTFLKTYKNATDLNADFVQNDSVLHINSYVKFSKKFRWIYTYYSYQETIQELGPLLVFPDSTSMLVYQAKRDTIDDIERWSDELVFESFYQTLLKELEKEPIKGLTSEFVESKRDELFVITEEFDGDLDNLVDNLLDACQDIFELDSAGPLRPILDVFWQKLEKYLDFIERSIGEEYKNNVEMPGQIFDANAEKMEGNVAFWEFDNEDFEIENWIMWVESRKLNIVPTVLTLLFIVASITIVVYLTIWETFRNHVARKRKSYFVLNKWISVLLIVVGSGLFIFGLIMTISMWKWTMMVFELTTWKDRLIFVFIDLIGLLLLLTGVLFLIKSKSQR
jgi:hypothetical protein